MTETVPERMNFGQFRGLAKSLHGVAMDADDENDMAICRDASAAMLEAATALEAAQARIAELEAEKREAALRYLADAGQLSDALATARREALEEAHSAVGAVEVPKDGWPPDLPGVWLCALTEALKAIDALMENTNENARD